MIAALIFILLLAAVLSGYQDRRWLSLTLFFASWLAIAMLFIHHVSERLDISL